MNLSVLRVNCLIGIILCGASSAEDSVSSTPKEVPRTRPEMKIALEALKLRTPRLPLSATGRGVGNGRMRAQYLPASWTGAGGVRGRRAGGSFAGDVENRFDYAFLTSLFWVVSRGNNCHYCLGHQELKLRSAGLDDDAIASLDSDWRRFDPPMQAALAYARKLTLEPYLIGDADIDALKPHFSDAQIAELTLTIGRYNATNRWTDGLGIPQDRSFSNRESDLLTPTSEKFRITTSLVTPHTRSARPTLPTAQEFISAIAGARQREARINLPLGENDLAALAEWTGERAPWVWESALAAAGALSQARIWRTMLTDDNLPPRLKAEMALVCAVHNRAWYAAAHAAQRLAELGASPSEILAIATSAGSNLSESPARGAALALAAKSTSDPHLVTDADVAAVRKHYSDAETAMIVQMICMANLFDRVTEALGLPLEADVAGRIAFTP